MNDRRFPVPADPYAAELAASRTISENQIPPAMRPFAAPTNAMPNRVQYGRPHPFNQNPAAMPPPGAPAGGGVVLPSIPVRPYEGLIADVPYSDPVPNQGDLEGVEASTVVLNYPPMAVETVVWRSGRAWNSCDIYIRPETPVVSAIVSFRIRVYAIADSGRTLVASGWIYVVGGAGGSIEIQNPWVAAARSSSSRWEVTLTAYYSPFNYSLPTGLVSVTCAAADDLPEPPDFVGLIPAAPAGVDVAVNAASVLGGGSVDVEQIPLLELCRITAQNTAVATPLYLHLHDLDQTAAVAGVRPLMTWGLGNVQGGGIDVPMSLRLVRNVRLVGSTTPLTTTVSANVAVQALVR